MVLGLRYLILLGLLVCTRSVYAQNDDEQTVTDFHHCFFEENTISVGIGPKVSLSQNLLGLNSRVYYNMGEHWCFGPEVSLLQQGEKTVGELSIISHYIIETPWVGIYPIIGGTFSQEEEGEHKESGIGATYGAGMHRNFGRVTGYMEYSGFVGFSSDQYWGLGIMYNFKI